MTDHPGPESIDAVVDGSNAAWEERSGDGEPRVGNLTAIIDALKEEGIEPLVVVDASLRHQVDDAEALERMLDDQVVRQAPAETQADTFILDLADEFDALVVSNDTFEAHADRYPWIGERRVPFMIVHNRVVLHLPDSDRE